MNKFDHIITEAETNISNAALNQVSAINKNLPANIQNINNAVLNKLGTQGGANHDLLVKMSDIFNDKTPSKWSDLKPEEQEKALELLTTAGAPITPKQNQDKATSPTPASTSSAPTPETAPTSNKIPTTVPGAVV
jgi:hypothetical protein